MCDGSLLIN